jgi:hypothetical protein
LQTTLVHDLAGIDIFNSRSWNKNSSRQWMTL